MFSVPAKTQEPSVIYPSNTPSHVAAISARHSNELFDSLNQRCSGISNRKSLPGFNEKPPMPHSHELVMHKISSDLSITRLIDIPEWAEDRKSRHSCKSVTTSGSNIIIFLERL